MTYKRLILAAMVVMTAAAAQAQVNFTATDGGAGPGSPRPNSDAKAAQFDLAASALGSEPIITFESAPVGNFTSLVVAPGVTASGSDGSGNPLVLNNTPSFPGNPPLGGFNTTFGGSNYIYMQGGSLTFTFATPIVAFGAYFSGIQPTFFQAVITYNDGANQSIDIPAADATNGGVSFAGFTDAGKSISAVTITATNANTGSSDFIGVDDVRYVTVSTPEPSTFALLAVSTLSGIALLRRRKSARPA